MSIWDYPFVVAFVLGLVSSLHCVGMCGGIVGMLSMSLPMEVRSTRGSLLFYTLAYNLGRIGSYTLAGLLAGLIGSSLLIGETGGAGSNLLGILFSLLVIFAGLYVAGWFPRLALVERLGKPLWSWLEPIGRRLLPVSSPPRALMFGLVWGWLPCSPVYSALALSLTTGSATKGAMLMLGFGLGTLPTLMATGFLAGLSTSLRRIRYIKQFAGGGLALMGLLGLLLVTLPHDHGAHHSHETHVHE